MFIDSGSVQREEAVRMLNGETQTAVSTDHHHTHIPTHSHPLHPHTLESLTQTTRAVSNKYRMIVLYLILFKEDTIGTFTVLVTSVMKARYLAMNTVAPFLHLLTSLVLT